MVQSIASLDQVAAPASLRHIPAAAAAAATAWAPAPKRLAGGRLLLSTFPPVPPAIPALPMLAPRHLSLDRGGGGGDGMGTSAKAFGWGAFAALHISTCPSAFALQWPLCCS